MFISEYIYSMHAKTTCTQLLFPFYCLPACLTLLFLSFPFRGGGGQQGRRGTPNMSNWDKHARHHFPTCAPVCVCVCVRGESYYQMMSFTRCQSCGGFGCQWLREQTRLDLIEPPPPSPSPSPLSQVSFPPPLLPREKGKRGNHLAI